MTAPVTHAVRTTLLITDADTWTSMQRQAFDAGYRHTDGSDEIRYPTDPENDIHVLELVTESPIVSFDQLFSAPAAKRIEMPTYANQRGLNIDNPQTALSGYLQAAGAKAVLCPTLLVSATHIFANNHDVVALFGLTELKSILALATADATLAPLMFVKPGSAEKWKTLLSLVRGLGWRFLDKSGNLDEHFDGIEYYDRRGVESTLRIDGANNALRFSSADRYVELGQTTRDGIKTMSRDQLPDVVTWLAAQCPNLKTKGVKQVSAVNQYTVVRSGDNVQYGQHTIAISTLRELERVLADAPVAT